MCFATSLLVLLPFILRVFTKPVPTPPVHVTIFRFVEENLLAALLSIIPLE